jgi:hypothetical protein
MQNIKCKYELYCNLTLNMRYFDLFNPNRFWRTLGRNQNPTKEIQMKLAKQVKGHQLEFGLKPTLLSWRRNLLLI